MQTRDLHTNHTSLTRFSYGHGCCGSAGRCDRDGWDPISSRGLCQTLLGKQSSLYLRYTLKISEDIWKELRNQTMHNNANNGGCTCLRMLGCFALAFSTRHVLHRTLTGLHDLQAVAALNAFLLVHTMAQTFSNFKTQTSPAQHSAICTALA